MIAYAHITSVGCYFKAHPPRPLQPDLRPSIGKVVSFLKSSGSTILGNSSLGTGDRDGGHHGQCDQKMVEWYLGTSKMHIWLLCNLSFVDGWTFDIIEQEQSFHNRTTIFSFSAKSDIANNKSRTKLMNTSLCRVMFFSFSFFPSFFFFSFSFLCLV